MCEYQPACVCVCVYNFYIVYIKLYNCIHRLIYICVCIYIYVCVYIYIYIHIYIIMYNALSICINVKLTMNLC